MRTIIFLLIININYLHITVLCLDFSLKTVIKLHNCKSDRILTWSERVSRKDGIVIRKVEEDNIYKDSLRTHILSGNETSCNNVLKITSNLINSTCKMIQYPSVLFFENNKSQLEISSLNCPIECDTISWVTWNKKSNFEYLGVDKSAQVNLQLDIKSGLQNPILNSFRLATNSFFPKQINNMPTPWMPGNPNIKSLKHRLLLNGLSNPQDLILLLGSFPNSSSFINPLPGSLKVFDSNNNQIDISKVCILLQDPIEGNILKPTLITNIGTEITFEVKQPGTSHGDIILLKNFPKNSYYFEIEHNNETSRSDDGVFINVGFPDCCKNVYSDINLTFCEMVVINGKTITSSGFYLDTFKTKKCDSIINYNIKIINKPFFSLGVDTMICEGEILILRSTSDSTMWSDGSKGKELVIDKPGIYWAEMINQCGNAIDTIIVNNRPKQTLELGPDRLICPGEIDTIWTNNMNTYWHDGSVGSYFVIQKSGIVKATILDICGELTDSLMVNYYPKENVNLPEDTILCEGDSIILFTIFDSTQWSNGVIGNKIIINNSGLYWAELKGHCKTIRDSIQILFLSKPILELGPDLQICPNIVDTIWSNNQNTLWQDGTVGPFYIIKKEGVIKASLSNFCGEVNDSVLVSYFPNIKVALPQDTILCEGESILLISPSDSTYWSSGELGSSIVVSKPGLYWAEIRNTCDLSRDSINVFYLNKPSIDLGKDVQICPNATDTIWSNDANTVWNDGSVGAYYIAKKEGTIVAQLSNFCGAVSDSIKVSYYPNSYVDLGPDTIICEGTILTLNSGSGNSKWYDNTIGSSHQITKAGTYWVNTASPCGVIADTIQIRALKVFEKPYLPNDTFVCEGININLSIPIVDELWNNQFLNIINIIKPGKYWYTYKDICNNLEDTIEVFYDSIPLGFPLDNLVFCGQDVFNFSTGNSKTEWSDGTIGSVVNLNKSGIYSYKISNSCGIFIDSISLEFIEDNGLYVPNVFSPNGDQVNDVFPGIQFTEDFDIEIYDRWGSRLFESSNKHWNGTFKSQDVPPGVYAYIIRNKFCNERLKYGNVTLVR